MYIAYLGGQKDPYKRDLTDGLTEEIELVILDTLQALVFVCMGISKPCLSSGPA